MFTMLWLARESLYNNVVTTRRMVIMRKSFCDIYTTRRYIVVKG